MYLLEPERWQVLPDGPLQIDWQASLSRGIISVITAGQPVDVAHGLELSINLATFGDTTSNGRGIALRSNQSSLYATAREVPSNECTILWLGHFYGTPSGSACLGGITYDASNSSPYVCAELKVNPSATDDVFLTFSTGGLFYNVQGGTYAAGPQTLLGRLKSGTQEIWQNGSLVGTGTQAITTLGSSATARIEVGDSLNARNPDAACSLQVIWNRYLDADEINEAMYFIAQVFQRRSAAIFSLPSGGVTLTIADATHAHAADALSLTQTHQLAVADATHAQPVDALSLTQTHQLATQDATHAHAANALDLTQLHQLVVQDATHGHPTDALVLTQTHLLAVADALHLHAADHLSLSGVVTLAINDALHGQLADGLTLETSATLVIADVLHTHAADALALGQVHVLVVADAVHAQLVDAVALSLPGAVLAGERALVIPTETRALVIVAESRALAIAAEIRALTIH